MLLLVAGVNGFIDPAFLFARRAQAITAADMIARGKNVVGAEGLAERRMWPRVIEDVAAGHEVVVLGSSRAMQIRGDSFPGRTFFNFSVSSATFEDVVALDQLLREQKQRPREVVLVLDPWILDAGNDQHGWKPLADPLARGRVRLGLDAVDLPGPGAFSRVSDLVVENARRWQQLVSPSYFQTALRAAWSGGPLRVSATDATSATPAIRMHDGSYVYSESIRKRTHAEFAADASYFGLPKSFLGHFDALDPASMTMFEKFTESLLAEKIDVRIVLAPYDPPVYAVLSKEPKYRKVVEAEEYFRRFAGAHQIPVAGSYDPSACGATEADLFDGMHPRAEFMARLLATPR